MKGQDKDQAENNSFANLTSDWRVATPPEIQDAVYSLRARFADDAGKIARAMADECYTALHDATIVGTHFPQLPTVAQGQTEPAVFSGWLNCYGERSIQAVTKIFIGLVDIAMAHRISQPADWADLQTLAAIMDESPRVLDLAMNACDKNSFTPDDWRAPRWFQMEPFGNESYNPTTAWHRVDQTATANVRQEIEERFIRKERYILGIVFARWRAHHPEPSTKDADTLRAEIKKAQGTLRKVEQVCPDWRLRSGESKYYLIAREAEKTIEEDGCELIRRGEDLEPTTREPASPMQEVGSARSGVHKQALLNSLNGLIADIKRKYRSGASNIEAMCNHLDSYKAPLPDTLKRAGKNTWHEAWSDKTTRPIVKRRISGVKI